MELDTIKLALAGLTGLISFIMLLANRRSLSLHSSGVLLLFSLLTVFIHYLIVSPHHVDTAFASMMFSATLWIALFFASSAFGPLNCLDMMYAVMSWLTYPITFYLMYLFINGSGIGDSGFYQGVTENPNIMSGYMTIFLFPIAYQNLVLRRNSLVVMAANFLVTSSILFLIFMTGSRGALLAVIVALAFLLMTSDRVRPSVKLLLIGLAAVPALLLTDFFFKYESSGIMNTREYLIILRLEAIAERPWFGWGLAADVNNSFNGTNIFPPQEKGNTALQFVEEFGVILGVPFFVALAVTCLRIANRFKQDRRSVWVAVLLIAALTHSMAETWMLNFRSFLAIAFWIVVFLGGSAVAKFGRSSVARVPSLADLPEPPAPAQPAALAR